MMISWALSKERRGIYIPVLHLARSAHLPHKTAMVWCRTSSPARPTQIETARRMKMPPPFPICSSTNSPDPPPVRTGCDRLLCVHSDSIRGQEVPGRPRSPAAFHPSVRWGFADSSECVANCTFRLPFLQIRPAPFPSRHVLLESLISASLGRNRTPR